MTERRSSKARKNQPWFRLDAGFMYDGKVVDLGADHGPAGPLVYVAILGAAKTHDDAGHFKMGWGQIAHHCFLPGGRDEARAIIASAERLGLIADVVGDESGFSATACGWNDFQRPMPRTEAERAADYRARKASEASEARDGVTSSATPVTGNRDATDTVQRQVQRQVPSSSPPSSVVARDAPAIVALTTRLAERIQANDPKARVTPTSAAWLKDMRLLVDRDGRTHEEVAAVIDWCQADSFWKSNILSPAKLRQKFTQLSLRMNRSPMVTGPGSAKDFSHYDKAAGL